MDMKCFFCNANVCKQFSTGIFRDGTALQMTFGNFRRKLYTKFGVTGTVTSKPKGIIMSEVKTYCMAGSVLSLPPKFHTLWTSYIIFTTIVFRILCSLGNQTAKLPPLFSGTGRGLACETKHHRTAKSGIGC